MDTKEQLSASRATEKASAALYILATSEGSLADRLTQAWVEEFGMLSDRELPGDFQESFDQMYELATTEGPDGDTGQFENSIRSMSAEQRNDLSRLMVRFAIEVETAATERS